MANLEKTAAELLKKKKKTLAVAESCSGGLLSHRLTNISGSSSFFKVGLIVYSYESKQKLLGVPSFLLKKYGAVSPSVTAWLAQNIRKIHRTDYGISITGIAGPTGATKTKPLGLTYIAFSSAEYNICLEYIFKGPRLSVKRQATDKALELLVKNISK